MSELVREENPGRLGPVREEDFMQRLRQRGVLDDIMRQLQFDDGRGTPKPATHGLNADEKLNVPAISKGKSTQLSAVVTTRSLVTKFNDRCHRGWLT